MLPLPLVGILLCLNLCVNCKELKGTVLVTGASSGIGASIATHLAKNGFGVVACARRVEKLEELAKQLSDYTVFTTSCDVSSSYSLADAFKAGEEALGSIDHVVANAGVEGVGASSEWEDIAEEFAKTFDINTFGTVRTYLAAIKAFKKNPEKDHSFIGVSSIAGTLKRFHGQGFAGGTVGAFPDAYAMSKASVDVFLRFSAGLDFPAGKDGADRSVPVVRVFGLAPAVYPSELVDRLLDGYFAGQTMEQYAGFNTLFPGVAGDVRDLSRAVLAMVDGSTGWKSGDIVVMDNDASYLMHEHTKDLWSEGHWQIDHSKVFDVTGNFPYDFEHSKTKLKGKKEDL